MDNIILRRETSEDYRSVEELTREAFWNYNVPGCDEHYLMHVMRSAESFIKELDFVAELEGKIVGNIAYAKSKLICDNGNCEEVITFGPLSVLPEYQGKGIGSMLVEHTKKLARELGYSAILIFGDPDYYGRFGFVEAEKFDIRTSDNMYDAALLALELIPGALSDCAGRFILDPVYDIDEKAAQEFDKDFPEKEKLSGLPSQERFKQFKSMVRPKT